MPGFLGTRGDFLSDLMVLLLGVIVPALGLGVWLGLTGRRRAHRAVMLALLCVLVLYVIVYETSLSLLGGTDYLLRATPLDRAPYLLIVGGHVTVGALSLLVGGWAVRRGQAVFAVAGPLTARHAKVAWSGVALLGLSAVSGVALYWVTFVAEG